MCGIVGAVGLKKKLKIDLKRIKKAVKLLDHRGPDSSGITVDNIAVLGHARLSIIDLDEKSKQPFTSSCSRYKLVFNGEIYNYLELKNDLLSKGYVFETNSDTEVLLYMNIEYGEEAVNKLIGMFSYCFIDLELEYTYLVRDRLGIKPLYYSINDGVIYFASEIKAILELSQIDTELNLDAINSYLSFRYPVMNDTFFKGIFSLSPGHIITIKDSVFENKEYWDLKPCLKFQEEDYGEEYYINELKMLMDSSVKYRMISDVPVGAFLSGGVDSSAITALMAKFSATPINTFTIGFGEEGFNEYEYANEVAEQYKTNHKEISVKDLEYFSTLKHLIEIKDAPLSVPNEVPLFLMSKEMKKTISVVLSGEGADEIFGGYGRIFRSCDDYEKMLDLNSKSELTTDESEFLKKYNMKYGNTKFKYEVDHFLYNYEYVKSADRATLFNNNDEYLASQERLYTFVKEIFDSVKEYSYLNKVMYFFEKIHLVGLLQRVDTATMAASVEARVPFVDHRVVEFAFKIPAKYKLKWLNQGASKFLLGDEISEKFDTPKYILKQTFSDLLSDNILYRKKMGFPVPLNNWFQGGVKEVASSLLLSKKSKISCLFNVSEIEKTIDQLDANPGSSMKLWNLINIEIFLKKYF